MLPISRLTIMDKDIKPDTRSFLDGILLSLLNTLSKKGIDTKLVDLLGANDVYVFRTEKVVFFSLSRSCFLPKPTIAEFSTDDIKGLEIPIVDTPQIVSTPNWNTTLSSQLHCIDPVTIVFPTNFLSLQGAEAESAHLSVANLLVSECERDVERKMGIARVNPIFRARDIVVDPFMCFVLMEFKSPYLEIYNTLIKPIIESEGLHCLKSNDIFSTTSVIEDIWENINRAALVIAEITSLNPNVMYELGICHTIGKNVMMITQESNSIPFNFRHMRCYPYKNDIPGSDQLRTSIRSVVQHMKSTNRKLYNIPDA